MHVYVYVYVYVSVSVCVMVVGLSLRGHGTNGQQQGCPDRELHDSIACRGLTAALLPSEWRRASH